MPRFLRTLLAAAALLGVAASAGCASASTGASPEPSRTYAVTLSTGLPFRTVDGHVLRMDACVPSGVAAAPTLVLVHGGGFTNGRTDDLDFVCRAAAQRGYATFSVDYRLLPAAYPAQLDDVAAAVRWLRAPARVRRFHLDPDRLGLLGASAGAAVVAELVARTPGAPARPAGLDAVVLLSGVYTPTGVTSGQRSIAEGYLGCSLTTAACRGRLRIFDVIGRVRRGDPATLIMNSTHELTPLPQARAYAKALASHDVPHRLYIATGDVHAEGVLAVDPAAFGVLFDFLGRRLRPS